jgi:hypothetical protein
MAKSNKLNIMKDLSKIVLSAVAALGVAASAHAQYVNGDLLVGFTGGTSDFIYDLGSYSSLALGQSWNLGANLGTQFGVVGAQNLGKHIYATSSDSAEGSFYPGAFFNQARANVTTIAGGLTAGNSRTPDPSDTTSWTYQTAQAAGTPGNTFQNNFFNPNTLTGTAAYFFDNDTINGTVTPENMFTYNSGSGMLTYQVVPEPSTFALLGVMGMAGVTVRRRLARQAQ